MDDFFEVLENSDTDGAFVATIKLNSGHRIYAAHFPGYPITPGAIQLQIIHELLERHLKIKLKLVAIPQCKFLKVLDPHETSVLAVHIEFTQTKETIDIKAWSKKGPDMFFKMNATFNLVE